jgi:uncharacterized protein (TIGR02001 family)
MKKSLIALALVGAFAAPAFAEEAAAPASEHTITGNLGLFSSYRFRGIDQTFGKPALQGGFDYSHSSGFYVGNWNSNVSQTAGFPDGNLEMDFYAGYKTTFGDFGLDVGGLYYYYPGSRGQTLGLNRGTVDNGEFYVAGSWQFLTLKYSYAVTDYFALPDSDGSSYLDLSANYDLGNGWGINGHVGHLWLKNYSTGDYTDWKLGVTKDVGGFVFGLSYVDTNADKGFYTSSALMHSGGETKNLGRGTAVLSVSKTF